MWSVSYQLPSKVIIQYTPLSLKHHMISDASHSHQQHRTCTFTHNITAHVHDKSIIVLLVYYYAVSQLPTAPQGHNTIYTTPTKATCDIRRLPFTPTAQNMHIYSQYHSSRARQVYNSPAGILLCGQSATNCPPRS